MAERSDRVPPQDLRIDRRLFLERMGLLTAAAAAGTPFTPSPILSAEPERRASRLPRMTEIQETEPWAMTVAELASLMHDGELAPVEVLEAYLRRIRAFDAALKAFNAVPEQAAVARARELGGRPWSGPLHGIPLAIKDNYYTAVVRTPAV